MKRPLILIVDDDEMLLKILRDTLITEGFNVIKATNAITAIFLLAKHKPDLILLDIIMPNCDGYRALEMIRLHSTVPVIMLTCLDDQQSLIQTMGNGGADDYIVKPFSNKLLIARIKAKLRRNNGMLRPAVITTTSPGGNTGISE